jgi:hypothetical protein
MQRPDPDNLFPQNFDGHIIKGFCELVVPFKIADLKAKGGPNDFQWDWVQSFGDTLGERGDILLYKSDKKGETASIFNQFTYALAIMAFAPGGVRFAGLHFEVTPAT